MYHTKLKKNIDKLFVWICIGNKIMTGQTFLNDCLLQTVSYVDTAEMCGSILIKRIFLITYIYW